MEETNMVISMDSIHNIEKFVEENGYTFFGAMLNIYPDEINEVQFESILPVKNGNLPIAYFRVWTIDDTKNYVHVGVQFDPTTGKLCEKIFSKIRLSYNK